MLATIGTTTFCSIVCYWAESLDLVERMPYNWVNVFVFGGNLMVDMDSWSEAVYTCLNNDEYLRQDFSAWGVDGLDAFKQKWCRRQEFRSVIRYRIRRFGDKKIIDEFSKLCGGIGWAFVKDLYLACSDIGPGLYIEHGFSSIVFAKKIGENFRLNQCVTVGANKGGNPTIGNNVSLYAGSIVIGEIEIGHNVKVGAGAVLFESVGDDCTVVSQRPRIIQR